MSVLDSLWQNVVSNLLTWAIILVGGLAVGALKKWGSKWFQPVLYGLGASSLIAVILFLTLPTREPAETGPENAETNIRAWLDAFGVATKKMPDESALFTLVATLNDGIPISISRPKKLDRYIVLRSHVSLSPELKALYDGLSDIQRVQVIKELSQEMARGKVTYTTVFPLSTVSIERRLPLTRSLSEASFIERIDDMDHAVTLARETLVLSIQKAPPAKIK